MSQQFSNWQITNEFLKHLIFRIQRRSNEDYAVTVLYSVVDNLKIKNDFFQHIQIVDNRENDDFDHIKIDAEINSFSSEKMYASLNQLFSKSVLVLGHVADFFFIREFKKSLGAAIVHELNEGGVNLDLMQSNYILEQQEMFHIENADLFEDVLIALIKILNKKFSIQTTVETMFLIISTVEKEFSFLKYVKISQVNEEKDSIELIVYPEINMEWSLKIGESIQRILELTKEKIGYREGDTSFEKKFTQHIGRANLTILDRIGVNVHRLKNIAEHASQKFLMVKAFAALIQFIGEKTSTGFAVSLVDRVLDSLKDEHQAIELIEIDKTQYSKGMMSIQIDDKINDLKPHQVGKLIRDIIQDVGEYLDVEHKMLYIEGIKKNLGDDILKEFDALGINLHIIELKIKM